jgi:hypothetical protein
MRRLPLRDEKQAALYPWWIICDIDGTLANIEHRLHHIKSLANVSPDWHRFNSECENDPVINASAELIRLASKGGWKIALSTGRTRAIAVQTKLWLARNGIPYDLLLMRPEGDYRSDYVIKAEHYEKHLRGKNILFVLEDRDRVVEMWRGLGLNCFQVQKGTY